jgi:AcrR family transcriptional regulator
VKIADATLQLLRERGPRAVTVEAVAAVSGVAKTTIYRRFRDRREMLSSALAPATEPDALPEGLPVEEQIRWMVAEALRAIDDGIGFGGLAALLTDEDPEFTTSFRSQLTDQRRRFMPLISAGIAAGDIRSDVDLDTLIDAVVGTYVCERARTGQSAPGTVDRVVALMLPAILA